jgi:hypothetical protein
MVQLADVQAEKALKVEVKRGKLKRKRRAEACDCGCSRETEEQGSDETDRTDEVIDQRIAETE